MSSHLMYHICYLIMICVWVCVLFLQVTNEKVWLFFEDYIDKFFACLTLMSLTIRVHLIKLYIQNILYNFKLWKLPQNKHVCWAYVFLQYWIYQGQDQYQFWIYILFYYIFMLIAYISIFYVSWKFHYLNFWINTFTHLFFIKTLMGSLH